jgi:hypothetical protein
MSLAAARPRQGERTPETCATKQQHEERSGDEPRTCAARCHKASCSITIQRMPMQSVGQHASEVRCTSEGDLLVTNQSLRHLWQEQAWRSKQSSSPADTELGGPSLRPRPAWHRPHIHLPRVLVHGGWRSSLDRLAHLLRLARSRSSRPAHATSYAIMPRARLDPPVWSFVPDQLSRARTHARARLGCWCWCA